jgi:hypothetical protein
LGGSGFDLVGSIALDATGAVVLTGTTYSSDFPTTPGAYDTSFNGGSTDAYVAKLSASGDRLVYSTFLGGSKLDQGNGGAVDAAGAAVVTGTTRSFGFPTTPGAFDNSFGGTYDAFVAKLNADGGLVYATYLGGFALDFGEGIAMDGAGAAFVTGRTRSPDFPTTPEAYDTTANGFEDAFVVKFDLHCTGDPGSWLTVPQQVPIGTFFDVCMIAPPLSQVYLLASGGPGPTTTPYGTFCLDFPPLIVFSFVMPNEGGRCFYPYLACDPDLVGAIAYLQFLSLDASVGHGISNQGSITVLDGPCH